MVASKLTDKLATNPIEPMRIMIIKRRWNRYTDITNHQ